MSTQSIAIVSDSYFPARGGVEEAARVLASTVSQTYEVSVVTHSKQAGFRSLAGYAKIPSISEYTDPAGLKVHPLIPNIFGRIIMLPMVIWKFPGVRSAKPSFFFDLLYFFYRAAFRKKLSRLLKGKSLVHCFSTSYLARLTAEVCSLHAIPFIMSPYVHFGRWGDSPAQLKVYAAANKILCPSASLREQFVNTKVIPSDKLELVPPVTAPPARSRIGEPPVPGHFVLFLGRREAHKGLAMLLVAFRGLEHMAKLVIAGPGERLETRSESVIDLGEVDDEVKHWLLSRCDVLCVPSSDETFGLVYVEAMSYGRAIVALNAPGVREIIENERTGLLISPEDTDSLRLALGRLLMNEHERRMIGRTAYEEYCKRFSADAVVNKILDIYRLYIPS